MISSTAAHLLPTGGGLRSRAHELLCQLQHCNVVRVRLQVKVLL
jgi:hypothetical protein